MLKRINDIILSQFLVLDKQNACILNHSLFLILNRSLELMNLRTAYNANDSLCCISVICYVSIPLFCIIFHSLIQTAKIMHFLPSYIPDVIFILLMHFDCGVTSTKHTFRFTRNKMIYRNCLDSKDT